MSKILFKNVRSQLNNQERKFHKNLLQSIKKHHSQSYKRYLRDINRKANAGATPEIYNTPLSMKVLKIPSGYPEKVGGDF